jgi:tRNA G18 (ribose-2'-O)-methylase SpoU
VIRFLSSATDEALAPYRLVGDPAALERAAMFVAEGRLIAARLLEDRLLRVHSVLVTPPAAAALGGTFSARPDVDVLVCEPAVVREITGFDFHRGCLALGYRDGCGIHEEELHAFARILALEGVGNPDNVGGLFRAALALGADAVLLDGTTADPLYRKAIRTSMGATLRVPYARAADWPSSLDRLRADGFRTIALTPRPDAIPLSEVRVSPPGRMVVVVGSEGAGLAPATFDRVDSIVRIPQEPGADSLNVVVAASIALYSIHRAR